MQFEYDPTKSEATKAERGIDFEEARQLWNDEKGIEAPTRSINEARFIRVAMLNGKVWTAVFTIRDEKIRIISVRRARKNEESRYHQNDLS